MSRVEAKLNAMGLALPPARKYPSPNRCGCVRVGTILFVSGHPPQHPDTKIREPGRLGADMTIEEGYTAARIAALLMLATIKGEVGSLDKVKRVIRLFGMVNSRRILPIKRCAYRLEHLFSIRHRHATDEMDTPGHRASLLLLLPLVTAARRPVLCQALATGPVPCEWFARCFPAYRRRRSRGQWLAVVAEYRDP